MNKSRLGKLGTLGKFSGIKQTSEQEETIEITSTEIRNQEEQEVDSKKTVSKKSGANSSEVASKSASRRSQKKSSNKDKLARINIEIRKSQKDWLTDKAFQVRENNDEPVPANERVYPRHLVRVAIALLQSQDIDWSEIKNEQQLRELLNL